MAKNCDLCAVDAFVSIHAIDHVKRERVARHFAARDHAHAPAFAAPASQPFADNLGAERVISRFEVWSKSLMTGERISLFSPG